MSLTRPLLAAKTVDRDLRALRYPVLGSPKIDGIRAMNEQGGFYARSMKRIPNRATQNFFGQLMLHGLDGELVVGNPTDKHLMHNTQSGVMSHGGDPLAKYYVFDFWDSHRGFHERLKMAKNAVASIGSPRIIFVEHLLIHSYDQLMVYEAECLEQGYEGVMVRSLTGPYKQGRSTLREGTLLKVKRFDDGEAQILGYEPLYRNENAPKLNELGLTKRSSSKDNKFADELLGSLTVQDCKSGVVFDIGSGFTEAQRIQLWNDRSNLVGRIVRYKSFSVGVKDKPRFPIFQAFRSPLDMVR